MPVTYSVEDQATLGHYRLAQSNPSDLISQERPQQTEKGPLKNTPLYTLKDTFLLIQLILVKFFFVNMATF